MHNYISVLDSIVQSSDASEKLRQAAQNIKIDMVSQYCGLNEKFMDALMEVAPGTVYTGLSVAQALDKLKNFKIADKAMGIVGSVMISLNIADFIYNISGVSEQRTRLYALSSSATAYAPYLYFHAIEGLERCGDNYYVYNNSEDVSLIKVLYRRIEYV